MIPKISSSDSVVDRSFLKIYHQALRIDVAFLEYIKHTNSAACVEGTFHERNTNEDVRNIKGW